MSIVVKYIVSFRIDSHPAVTKLLRSTLSPRVFCLLLILNSQFSILNSQVPDTVQRLREVTISAQRTPSETRTATPTQVLDAERLEHIGAIQLSDAVKTMAGVTLKDYGGVGGVKTVSSRGLGSQFSAVTIDGVPVDDSQNGQVDLGRYTLGNTAYISLSQGQEQSALLSARAYAAGNVLNMETAEPAFWPGERVKLKAGVEGGSFGLLSPTLLWEQRWSKKVRSSFFVNYLRSDGDYPFTLYNTASGHDDSHQDRRSHSAVWMTTADGNLFYTLGEGNDLSVKAHYMRGFHELPGPVHLHSQTLSGQSSNEELAFVQGRWKVEREKWKAQLLTKLRYSYDDFRDTTPGTDTYDRYRQREAYLSLSLDRTLTSWLTLDLAADFDASHLNSSLKLNNDVTRSHLIAVASLVASTARLETRANILYSSTNDRVADLKDSPSFHHLSPYLSLMYTIGQGTTLRAFYKESFRAPNFGELYFFQLMAPKLNPEHARQVNLGITQCWELATLTCQLTADAYYNRVNDKIVSYPQHSMYYWTTANVGRVDILGIDATANAQCSLRNTQLSIQLNYSYQHAVDHTQEGSKTYGHQIVYTPRHSGGGTLRWETRWVNIGATAMVVGDRYYMQQNNDKYRLPAYCDLGLSADRSFDLRVGTLSLRAALLNLLDTQYEIVRSYPMMGRNWKISITYEI